MIAKSGQEDELLSAEIMAARPVTRVKGALCKPLKYTGSGGVAGGRALRTLITAMSQITALYVFSNLVLQLHQAVLPYRVVFAKLNLERIVWLVLN